MWAGQGWAVFYPNPRGSTNYGEKFLRANVADWGGGDFADIMTGVDALIERGVADKDRLAHIGWSYGGYMTAWAITQTTRFKAAMVGAGLTNMWSMYGTNDIPNVLIGYFGGIANKETLPLYMNRSAMTHIDNVTTPTLILHGGNDERVPLGQAQELFRGLKDRGKTTELVVLSPRRTRHHGVLSSEGPSDADPRLGDHPRRRTAASPRPLANDRLRSENPRHAGRRRARRYPCVRPGTPGHPVRAQPRGGGVLDLDELLAKIPRLIARLTPTSACSRSTCSTSAAQELRIAYAEGYPEDAAKRVRLTARPGHGGHGGAGAAVDPAERRAHATRATSASRRARSPRWWCRCATRTRCSARSTCSATS